MSKKGITEFIRKKHVGVTILDGRLKAFEIKDKTYLDKPIQEVYPNIVQDKKPESYWYNQNTMKEIFSYVIDNTKKALFKPRLYIAIPFETYQPSNLSLILDAALQSKWSYAYIFDSYLCAANGSGIEPQEVRKKIFIYSLQNLTYIGLVFAGRAINVKIIEKESTDLTKIDIKNSIEGLLNEIPKETPQRFTNIRLQEGESQKYTKYELPKDYLEMIIRGWREDIEKKIYLSVPLELKNKFGLKIGKYQIDYLDNQKSFIEGLRKAILGFNDKKNNIVLRKTK